MMRGLCKWMAVASLMSGMGFVKDNYLVPHRYSLGDLDEDQWEKGPDGEPRDPWSQSYLVQLVELSPPHGTLTFSRGRLRGQAGVPGDVPDLSEQCPAQPDMHMVVELAVKGRPTKSFGKIPGPWSTVQGWTSLEDVKAGRKIGASKAKAAEAKPARDFNDELPDWSTPAA